MIFLTIFSDYSDIEVDEDAEELNPEKMDEDDDQYISVEQRKQQFSALSNSSSQYGSQGSILEKPVYSTGQPVMSHSRTSMGSHESNSRPMSQMNMGVRTSVPVPKPMMKPASNITNFDNRRGVGRSLPGDDDINSISLGPEL